MLRVMADVRRRAVWHDGGVAPIQHIAFDIWGKFAPCHFVISFERMKANLLMAGVSSNFCSTYPTTMTVCKLSGVDDDECIHRMTRMWRQKTLLQTWHPFQFIALLRISAEGVRYYPMRDRNSRKQTDEFKRSCLQRNTLPIVVYLMENAFDDMFQHVSWR